MAKLTKKAKTLAALDAEKLYGVDEALKTIKELATAKFDETIEVALNLGVDPRHADRAQGRSVGRGLQRPRAPAG